MSSNIVYIFIAVLVGWVIGFLDSNLRSSKKIASAESKAQLAFSEAEKKIAEVQAQVKPDSPAIISEPSLLSLKIINSAPFLELDGALLNIKTISADQKKRLFELLTFIRSLLEGGQPTQSVQISAAPVSPQSKTAPFYQETLTAGANSSMSQPNATSAETKESKPLNAIEQIDAVLQVRLANSLLAGKGIRLTQRTASGGVQVTVGSQTYPTLADVPDPQIKTAVRAAIAEWEEKRTRDQKPAAQSAASAAGLTYMKPPPPAKPADGKEFKSLSIVAQIDTVLQARLENSPLMDKGIRLIERTALGGVEVYVGHQKYPSLDDVPDPEIKYAIRAAIAEWEKKYTPGM